MQLRESSILAGSAFLAGFAALLALVGLATPYWLKRGSGLWNCHNVCSTGAATLTTLAFIFLAVAFFLLIVILMQLFTKILRWIPIVLLILATLFLLSASTRYLQRFQVIGYSFELIIAAQTVAFFASTVLAFWFGTNMSHMIIARTTALPVPTSTFNFAS